ncbi:uncharacterized protein LOC121640169 [Melanotaenia boesemani]|uniref:uncharacterized protein LOC121640169 n=1 Tax=Melanotaenia boesemani TaxID=1250792 RepID=UPI001C050A8F|nr:uncharacterized protein LOC121640169 [Melanotaenia boesemani]
MAFTSLCLLICCFSAATASVQMNIAPDRSQFFRYDRITLTCVGNSSGWIVKRNTTLRTAQACEKGWATARESSCTIDNAYPEDTGVYWCESPEGESNTINITVTAHSVIIKSPVHPVMEGDDVPLHCSHKKEDDEYATSNFSATFYKDGTFIGREETGKKTLRAVSKSKDEGFYKCQHPSGTNSSQTWLTVRDKSELDPHITPPTPSPPPPPISGIRLICGILLFIIFNIIFIFCIYRYCKWKKARAQAKRTSLNQGLMGGKK